ncbi:urease accessory protein [Rhizobiales bacterium GAS191]|nr:urease accessory protein [Rhizobiales bacterium GAS191]
MAQPIRASSITRALAVREARVVDTVTLDHEDRYRRRAVLTCDGGLEVLLDLDKPARIEDGDALKLEDGRLVRVVAAPEELIEVTSDNPARLMRAAWHLGNRHTPAEIGAEAIYFASDHVLVEMLRGLGLSARPVTRPFRPERGAYEHAGHPHAGPDHGGHEHAGHDHGGHQHGDAHHDHGDRETGQQPSRHRTPDLDSSGRSS